MRTGRAALQGQKNKQMENADGKHAKMAKTREGQDSDICDLRMGTGSHILYYPGRARKLARNVADSWSQPEPEIKLEKDTGVGCLAVQ